MIQESDTYMLGIENPSIFENKSKKGIAVQEIWKIKDGEVY